MLCYTACSLSIFFLPNSIWLSLYQLVYLSACFFPYLLTSSLQWTFCHCLFLWLNLPFVILTFMNAFFLIFMRKSFVNVFRIPIHDFFPFSFAKFRLRIKSTSTRIRPSRKTGSEFEQRKLHSIFLFWYLMIQNYFLNWNNWCFHILL